MTDDEIRRGINRYWSRRGTLPKRVRLHPDTLDRLAPFAIIYGIPVSR